MSDIENLEYDKLIKDIDKVEEKTKRDDNIFEELTREIMLEEELERINLRVDEWTQTIRKHLVKHSKETEESLQDCLTKFGDIPSDLN